MQDTVIRSFRRILLLLTRLRDRHTLILIRGGEGDREPAPSMVLDLRPEQGELVVDLPSDSSSFDADEGSETIVTARMGGVDIRFRGRLLRFEALDGGPALILEWPEQVNHLDRRAYHRVWIASSEAWIEARSTESDVFEGRLLDLSVGGFAAALSPTRLPELGEMLDCRLWLAEETLAVKAEVRWVSRMEKKRQVRIGVRFVDMQPRRRQRMRRLVARLERHAIRSDPTR